MTTIEMLQAVKTLLTDINGITSVEIGIEPNLSPSQYPMIRIVPIRSETSDRFYGAEKTLIDIYIGTHQNKADGLEANYAQLNAWEQEIKHRIATNTNPPFIQWKTTQHDEDRLPGVKVLIMSIEAEG